MSPSSRLLELLAPFHDAAVTTARRLSRCNAEGDDLLQEAVLRAWHRLPELRDESRFRPWFFAILLSAHRRRVEPEPIDETREPGMTDEQVREKILAQLRARGLDAEVVVQGDRVQIRAHEAAGE